ncbi:hypothetical protein [Pectobacterium brasiliense]|uniref:hypothetical protein n=1 Tax=Pectobacterium brasiliense TaxID=180957 RepID=UPI0025A0529C|nr:hypothetical protein [Pectobacterium brasiliense]WJM82892.1 hypothetical protein QTI90_09160 [Pectobacterium brasiliense]
MPSQQLPLSEILKQAARQARGEQASGNSPVATTLAYLNNEDPAKAHQRAKTKDLKTDTKLKKLFARWFIGILIGQLIAMNGIFICIGLKWLNFSDFVINLFMAGTLAEVFGIVLVMARYLFSKRD